MTTDTHTHPIIQRFRHELKRRRLTVTQATDINPGMRRIELEGDDLSDFQSLGFDDHIKIFIPDPSGESIRRDYTPRRFDAAQRRLTLDFALHEAGPATRWAIHAKEGDTLEIGGPRGSSVISGDIAEWLLIGDETALPAIGRFVEEAGADTRIRTLVAVESEDCEQAFTTSAQHETTYVHRPLSTAGDASALIAVLERMTLAERSFIWIAAEGSATRALRAYLTGPRGHALTWMKASGYWVIGKADAHEHFD